MGYLVIYIQEFTEINPDKGTETISVFCLALPVYKSLQKLTPIRGRKL